LPLRFFYFHGFPDNALIVLDGIRHVDVWKSVQRLVSQNMLIYVDGEEEQRLERLLVRDRLNLSSAQSILQHSMDQRIVLLKSVADLLVISESLEVMIAKIRDLLKQKRFIS
jgi:dephospho-CoA kinase